MAGGGITLGWGIIGAGGIAHRFAADLRYVPGSRLVAVSSRDPQRAASCRAAAGSAGREARHHADAAALLADPGVEAVYIALPTALHRDFALAALAVGKPVLCEKPLAQTAAAAAAVVSAARQGGTFCMESLWTRFLPVIAATRQAIDEGVLGDLAQVEASLGFPRPDGPGNPASDPALGGGVLLDLGVYPLSLARQLLGPLRLLGGMVARSASGTDRDVVAALSARLADGRDLPVSLRASHSSRLSNALTLAGSAGHLWIEAPFLAAESARLRRVSAPALPGPAAAPSRLRGSTPFKWLRRAALRSPFFDGAGFGGPPYPGTGLQFAAMEVARCLAQGLTESPLMPLDQSVEVLSIIDRLRAST